MVELLLAAVHSPTLASAKERARACHKDSPRWTLRVCHPVLMLSRVSPHSSEAADSNLRDGKGNTPLRAAVQAQLDLLGLRCHTSFFAFKEPVKPTTVLHVLPTDPAWTPQS